MSFPHILFEQFIEPEIELPLQAKAISLANDLFLPNLKGAKFNECIKELENTLRDCLCSGHPYYYLVAQCFYYHFEQSVIINIESKKENSLNLDFVKLTQASKSLNTYSKQIFVDCLLRRDFPDEAILVQEFFKNKKMNTMPYYPNLDNLEEALIYCYFEFITGIDLHIEANHYTSSFSREKASREIFQKFTQKQKIFDDVFGVFKEKATLDKILEKTHETNKTQKFKI